MIAMTVANILDAVVKLRIQCAVMFLSSFPFGDVNVDAHDPASAGHRRGTKQSIARRATARRLVHINM